MLRWIAPQLTAMTPEDTQAIIGVALRTLERVPMTIDGTGEFFEHLRAFGCRIEGRSVHFTRPVVDQTMTRIAASKASNAREASDPPPKSRGARRAKRSTSRTRRTTACVPARVPISPHTPM